MTWVLAGALALIAFAAMIVLLKLPRATWEATAAALVLGLAGYALQGSPGLPGAPKAAAERIESGGDASAVEARRALTGQAPAGGDPVLLTADAFARHGQFADAAGVLRGVVEEQPANAEAWTALGNALVAHAEGNVGPPALYAYRRAVVAAPAHPAPPFFMGLALIRGGRLEQGRAIWAELLARSPADAPWRPELTQRLQELDAYLARRQAGQ